METAEAKVRGKAEFVGFLNLGTSEVSSTSLQSGR